MSTVTVALKHPNGIDAVVDGKKITFNGWNSGSIVQVGTISKVGLTPDVPTEFWDKWRVQFKDHPLFTNGLIHAQATESKAKAEAKERKETVSKMEAIDPNKKVNGIESFKKED